MAAAAHPPETCQSLGPSPAPPPSCPQRPWAALLVSASEAEPPCGNAGRGAPAAPASPAARLRPGPGQGAPVHGHIGFIAPVTASARGRLERRGDARSLGSASAPWGPWSQTGPRGEAGRTPGKITTSQGSPPSSQPASAPSLPGTHPRALTPRKQPQLPAPAAALVAQAPPAGGRAAIRGAQAAAGQRPWGRRVRREAGRWSRVLT